MPVLYQLLFPSSLQSSFGQCCTLTVPVCCVAHFLSFLSIYLARVNCRHDASCSSCVGKAMSAFPKAPCAAPWCINNCIDEHPIPLFSVFSTSIFTAVKDETVIWWVHLERGKLGAGLSESLPASEKSLSSARCVLWARAKLTPFISSPPHNVYSSLWTTGNFSAELCFQLPAKSVTCLLLPNWLNKGSLKLSLFTVLLFLRWFYSHIEHIK